MLVLSCGTCHDCGKQYIAATPVLHHFFVLFGSWPVIIGALPPLAARLEVSHGRWALSRVNCEQNSSDRHLGENEKPFASSAHGETFVKSKNSFKMTNIQSEPLEVLPFGSGYAQRL